jgi:hypothetical protein
MASRRGALLRSCGKSASGKRVLQHGRRWGVARVASSIITAPEHPVQVEIDYRRGVVYVHVDGRTVLRICRVREVGLVQHYATLETRESRATALAPKLEL